jgi:SAM-dependent methyltransferase
MKNTDEYVRNLFTSDAYIIQNPSLHEEDSPWKVSKIIPFIDRFISCINRDEISLLDVGGGAGSILNALSSFIEDNYSIKVVKLVLDLSPAMLEIQKKRTAGLIKALNEDIRDTSLGDKEIDLTLMIDVLEHVPNPIKALEEVKRISNFAIFKVPIDDNYFFRVWNFINRGEHRQLAMETMGHINIYSFSKLRCQIEEYAGCVLDFDLHNVWDYWRKSEHYKSEFKAKRKLVNFVAAHMFKLSPKACSLIFGDSVLILVKCY